MTFQRLFGTWLAIAVLMTANGALRELVLRDLLPGRWPNTVSAISGALIIIVTTRVAFRRFAQSTTAALVQSALLLVTLTVVFETAIGRLVDGKSWSELAMHYAFWRGALWPYLLLLFSLTPFIWGRWLRPDSSHAH
jgi:hypothetical protein